MSQITWRAPDELVEKVRRAAEQQGRSVNEYLSRLAEAAVNPDLADDELQRVRERLARAGLVATTGSPRRRPEPRALAAARRRAGSGTPLSELVQRERG
jgi:hypothetical protein